MPKKTHTDVSQLHKREAHLLCEVSPEQHLTDWQTIPEKARGQSLLKNLAVASALVLCAVTLRTGALPSLSEATDAVLTAATDQSLLDDQLGKLSFVSALFPETVLVFGTQQAVLELSMPVSGGTVVHAWSESEPYMTMRTNTRNVLSAAAGEVIGVYHGHGDERLVEISHQDGTACLYGNLESVSVSSGDYVEAGTVLGQLLPGTDLAFELRKNGVSIDPSSCFPE